MAAIHAKNCNPVEISDDVPSNVIVAGRLCSASIGGRLRLKFGNEFSVEPL